MAPICITYKPNYAIPTLHIQTDTGNTIDHNKTCNYKNRRTRIDGVGTRSMKSEKLHTHPSHRLPRSLSQPAIHHRHNRKRKLTFPPPDTPNPALTDAHAMCSHIHLQHLKKKKSRTKFKRRWKIRRSIIARYPELPLDVDRIITKHAFLASSKHAMV